MQKTLLFVQHEKHLIFNKKDTVKVYFFFNNFKVKLSKNFILFIKINRKMTDILNFMCS